MKECEMAWVTENARAVLVEHPREYVIKDVGE